MLTYYLSSAWVYPVVVHWGWDAGNKGCFIQLPGDSTELLWGDCNEGEYLSAEREIDGQTQTFSCTDCEPHGSGWLVDLGYNDFAGSGIVHLLGGVCALVGCFFMGPRRGRFTKDGKPIEMPGHSVPLAALGGFILLFGFLAFNGGSQVSNCHLISFDKNDVDVKTITLILVVLLVINFKMFFSSLQ